MINLLANPALLAVSASRVTGGGMFKPLYWLFGVCMEFLLGLLNNQYFVAIIIFTVATRVLMLPFNIRQQKTMAKTTRLQPKINKIQKKYPDPRDRAKMQEELQDLYTREGHNPMNMGCGTMVFQMVFLMGIVGIIYYPLSYVLGMGAGLESVSAELVEYVKELGLNGNYIQLGILENWASFKEPLMEKFPELFNAANVSAIEAFREGMYIGGIDMTVIPDFKHPSLVSVIPAVSFLTSMLSTVISTLIQRKNNPAQQQQMSQMIMMSLMMPVFSLVIAFQVPAAVGFYWIISNVVAILQQLYIAAVHPPRKSQAKLMIENTIERRSREENIKKIK